MKRTLFLISLLVVCATSALPAFAFRGRPASSLRFDGTDTANTAIVASDGKDFMVLSTGAYTYGQDRVYVQRVAGGSPVGPRLAIGKGIGVGIAWTGTDYLAAWSTAEGLWTARVSRFGALLAAPSHTVAGGRVLAFASNGQTILSLNVIDRDTVQVNVLALDGTPIAPAAAVAWPSYGTFRAAVTPSGYAIVEAGLDTAVRLIRNDGTIATPERVIVDGPYETTTASPYDEGAWIATNGTDIVVIIDSEKFDADSQLKSVVLDAAGKIKRPAEVIYTNTGNGFWGLRPTDLLWTGSNYVLALGVSYNPDRTHYAPAVLQLGSNGKPLDNFTYISDGTRRELPLALGWNGDTLLLPWANWSDSTYPVKCAAIPLATLATSASASLGRTLATQSGLTLAASQGQYLAAWFETTSDNQIVVRASRLDANGNYLDGDGIVLGTSQAPRKYYTSTIAADSDGTNWLVVWADGAVHARRLSRNGALLDAPPLHLDYETYDVAVRWTGSTFLVASSNGDLSVVRVTRDGSVSDATKLAVKTSNSSQTTSYLAPSIAVADGSVLVAYDKDVSGCSIGTPGGCYTMTSLLGNWLDVNGYMTDPLPFVISPAIWPPARLASSSNRILAVWGEYDSSTDYGAVWGTFVNMNPPGPVGRFKIGTPATNPVVAFDGHDFVAAWSLKNKTLQGATITPSGTIGEPATMSLDDGEVVSSPVMAGSAGLPALIGFLDRHPAYDNVSRAALLFASDLPAANVVPRAPSILSAVRAGTNEVEVHWQPAANSLGTSIELQLPDGAYRPIGVAAAGATSARVSLGDLNGSGIRLRAWNAAGFSDPSLTLFFTSPRPRSIRIR